MPEVVEIADPMDKMTLCRDNSEAEDAADCNSARAAADAAEQRAKSARAAYAAAALDQAEGATRALAAAECRLREADAASRAAAAALEDTRACAAKRALAAAECRLREADAASRAAAAALEDTRACAAKPFATLVSVGLGRREKKMAAAAGTRRGGGGGEDGEGEGVRGSKYVGEWVKVYAVPGAGQLRSFLEDDWEDAGEGRQNLESRLWVRDVPECHPNVPMAQSRDLFLWQQAIGGGLEAIDYACKTIFLRFDSMGGAWMAIKPTQATQPSWVDDPATLRELDAENSPLMRQRLEFTLKRGGGRAVLLFGETDFASNDLRWWVVDQREYQRCVMSDVHRNPVDRSKDASDFQQSLLDRIKHPDPHNPANRTRVGVGAKVVSEVLCAFTRLGAEVNDDEEGEDGEERVNFFAQSGYWTHCGRMAGAEWVLFYLALYDCALLHARVELMRHSPFYHDMTLHLFVNCELMEAFHKSKTVMVRKGDNTYVYMDWVKPHLVPKALAEDNPAYEVFQQDGRQHWYDHLRGEFGGLCIGLDTLTVEKRRRIIGSVTDLGTGSVSFVPKWRLRYLYLNGRVFSGSITMLEKRLNAAPAMIAAKLRAHRPRVAGEQLSPDVTEEPPEEQTEEELRAYIQPPKRRRNDGVPLLMPREPPPEDRVRHLAETLARGGAPFSSEQRQVWKDAIDDAQQKHGRARVVMQRALGKAAPKYGRKEWFRVEAAWRRAGLLFRDDRIAQWPHSSRRAEEESWAREKADEAAEEHFSPLRGSLSPWTFAWATLHGLLRPDGWPVEHVAPYKSPGMALVEGADAARRGGASLLGARVTIPSHRVQDGRLRDGGPIQPPLPESCTEKPLGDQVGTVFSATHGTGSYVVVYDADRARCPIFEHIGGVASTVLSLDVNVAPAHGLADFRTFEVVRFEPLRGAAGSLLMRRRPLGGGKPTLQYWDRSILLEEVPTLHAYKDETAPRTERRCVRGRWEVHDKAPQDADELDIDDLLRWRGCGVHEPEEWCDQLTAEQVIRSDWEYWCNNRKVREARRARRECDERAERERS